MDRTVKLSLEKTKIVCVVGPTSSGKSELAVDLARRFNGEIISCDSRQIYKGMDLGTGKVPGKWNRGVFVYKNIPHHLIDFVSPKKSFSVAVFQKKAQKEILNISRRGRLPILCGGTGHWVDAVVFDQQFPEVKPNSKLRKTLEKLNADQLYKKLLKLDSHRAQSIDRHNKRRLVRALEIVLTTGKPIPPLEQKSHFNTLWLGINLPQEKLFSKIDKRLKQRFKAGLVTEVKKLHQSGLSWRRLEIFGLEYKFVSLYLQKKLSETEMFSQLSMAIKHYAKRQQTWFKRNKNIDWTTSEKQAKTKVAKFL